MTQGKNNVQRAAYAEVVGTAVLTLVIFGGGAPDVYLFLSLICSWLVMDGKHQSMTFSVADGRRGVSINTMSRSPWFQCDLVWHWHKLFAALRCQVAGLLLPPNNRVSIRFGVTQAATVGFCLVLADGDHRGFALLARCYNVLSMPAGSR